jgi:putative membrane protein
MIQRLVRVGFSMALIGMMSSACDGDDNTDTDTNAQTGDGGENPDASVETAGRAGSTPRAGSGGSGGTPARAGTGGVSAAAGRGGTAGGAGANGGSGGSTPTTAGRGGAGGTSVAGGSGGTGGTGGAGGATSTTLSDAQIAAVTSAANTGEISLAMLALTRAQLPATRAFAQMMSDMHGAAQTRQNAVLDVLDLTVAANPVSMQLERDAMQVMTQLNTAAPNQFDLLYIRSQVEIHTKVLSIIDGQLLVSVDAPALRADLVLTRTEVAAHLAAAQVLLDQLEDLTDAGVP